MQHYVAPPVCVCISGWRHQIPLLGEKFSRWPGPGGAGVAAIPYLARAGDSFVPRDSFYEHLISERSEAHKKHGTPFFLGPSPTARR